ncbi:LOW QUALITY PROTEIN: C-factor-like [Falco biarmicus]|uniref:LOW QUALITY PROTEIN: C-factor-like n=1 Tax=Falco biarmicus TaxID=345155 RepID=UPI0024BC4F4A|nr:LOW QUALITY PROTEIN: C-factor-like [Falco biarmicus]
MAATEMAALAQSVLVTGSNCSIRRELVRQLAASPRPPQHIFATCRNPEGPRGKELAAQHPGIKLVQLDAVNLSSIQGAVRAVGSHLEDQGLNLLINNAGISSQATLRSLDSQEMLSMFATNVVGPLQVAKEFLPLLKKAAKGARKGGLSCSRAAVINISSKLGSIGLCLRVPEAPMYAYRASKAAQNMVTRCMAADFQDKGILCAAIHPGWVKTDMGTEKAPLMVERSMRGILAVLASLSQDTSGAFLDWAGSSLPW